MGLNCLGSCWLAFGKAARTKGCYGLMFGQSSDYVVEDKNDCGGDLGGKGDYGEAGGGEEIKRIEVLVVTGKEQMMTELMQRRWVRWWWQPQGRDRGGGDDAALGKRCFWSKKRERRLLLLSSLVVYFVVEKKRGGEGVYGVQAGVHMWCTPSISVSFMWRRNLLSTTRSDCVLRTRSHNFYSALGGTTWCSLSGIKLKEWDRVHQR
ncbi:hypothetical protein DM860_007248 [Cuscuta australis]|uniref:Uncharacterized protein n=1 Tax=Cuscuta australis TaxID=267555 RepID=A0A328E7D0_9ASTE|nr:hypothetical protein DM860_007248 [Cuscuta australis]